MSSRTKVVGIHQFAGGFNMGVSRVADVDTHIEVHGFGTGTAASAIGVNILDVSSDWRSWPAIEAQVACGNPRCTGFSTMTAGLSESAHGLNAKQNQDLIQLCHYGASQDYEFVVFESVQQAFTTGRPLMEQLYRDVFKPKNYRLAHVLLNAAAFDNPQLRARYFFVAYKDCYKFNIEAPEIPSIWHPTVYSHIGQFRDVEVKEWNKDEPYDLDTCMPLTDDEKHAVKFLPNGFGLNALAKYRYEVLTDIQKQKWDLRNSDKPFSLHSITRISWATWCKTLHSGCKKWIHPEHNRTLTVRELCALMGWPPDVCPIGPDPAAQIAKGIVPNIGEWLMRQIDYSLQGAWGEDEWESSYDANKNEWDGQDSTGMDQKVFNLSKYYPDSYDIERFPEWARTNKHKLPVFNLSAKGKKRNVYDSTIS